MAGKIVKAVGAAITGVATSGSVTVGSSSGFYVGARANLSKSGVSAEILITAISGNNIYCRIIRDANDSPAAAQYGNSVVTAFDAGRIDQPEQFVFNANDKPLD
jgi:hypothetical protein